MTAARKVAPMGYEQLVDECKRLRHEFEKSEARFFLFLIVVEDEHAEAWKESGHGNFDSFLRSNDLCMVDRYRAFRAGAEKVGPEKAAAYGVPWVIAAGRMQDRGVTHLGERAKAFLEVHKTAPSALVVKTWEAEERGKERAENEGAPDRTRQHASELARLRAEVAKYKTDLAAAKKRISDLESELAKAKKR